MPKLLLYIATSLDGKIAKADGSVDWLEAIPAPDESHYGWQEFYDSIGITIQGSKTYDQVMSWGIDFPYADKENYVFTRKQGRKNTEHVNFISENHANFVHQLKKEGSKDIWLVGGGELNAMFLAEGLIDEIQMFVMPVVLGEGIDMFASLPKDRNLKLILSKSYSNGVVELRYQVLG